MMTREQFTADLTSKQQVNFNGSVISVPSKGAAKLVTETINLVLPSGHIIGHGVQPDNIEGIPDSWKGTLKLNWVLSLQSHLLFLNMDRKGNGKLHLQFQRKERVRVNLEGSGDDVFEKATLSLYCDDSVIVIYSTDQLKPKALCEFVSSILA